MRTVNNIAISSKFIIHHIVNPPKYGPNQLWRINEYSLYVLLQISPINWRPVLLGVEHVSFIYGFVTSDLARRSKKIEM